MPLKFSTLIIILLIFMILPQVSNQTVFASCIGPLNLSDYKNMADAVVFGEVISTENGTATIKVEKYYKGEVRSPEIQVIGRQSEEAVTSVDFEFEEGKRYLLFLESETPDLFKTNSCMGNREAEESSSLEQLKDLGQGHTPDLPPAAKLTLIAKIIAFFSRLFSQIFP